MKKIPPQSRPKMYTVYDRKTDEMEAVGTPRECIEQMGWPSVNSFHVRKTFGRKGKGKYYIYRWDEDDE